MNNFNRIYRHTAAFAIGLFVCSLVSAQQTKNLLILQTSDTHSQIEPVEQKGDRDYQKGGYARRAAVIDYQRNLNPQLLLFDCGDFCQGTPYFNLFKGDVEITLMNKLHYDAATIGNHEFDFGLDNMARIFKKAQFPIVCANYDCSNSVLKDCVKPYVVLQREGLRIGVFGLSPRLKGLVQEKNYGSLVYLDPVETANRMASLLRDKEKCDVVVCLSHLGINMDKELVPQIRNIDVVLGGHSHTFMKEPISLTDKDGKTVKVLHTGARGVKVGLIQMTLEEK